MYMLDRKESDRWINDNFKPSKSDGKMIAANDNQYYEPGFHIIDSKEQALAMAGADPEFSVFEVLYDDVVAIGFEQNE